jgi:hypothetical protein
MACFRSLSNCFLMAMAVLVFLTGPARAAVDKEGAEKLRAVVEKAMADLGDSAAAAGKTLQLDGPVMVEPNGTYYAVTLPGLKYGYMDGEKVEMGMIAINAMPAAKPGQWKMTVALPTPLSHFDDDQQLEALTTIGAQSFAGIWSEELGAFVKLNAAYQNIVRMDPEHRPVMTIKGVTIKGDSTQNPQGAWSGTYNVEATGIAYDNAQAGAKGSLESVTGQFKLKDYSLAATKDYDAKIAALSESYNAGEGEMISVMHVLGIYNLVTEFISSAWQGVDIEIAVKNAAFSQPGKSGRPPVQTGFADARIGFGLEGLGTDKVMTGLRVGYNGLSYSPAPVRGNVVPTQLNMDLRVAQLPLMKLLELGRQGLQMTAGAPSKDIADLAMLTVLAQAPQALTQAGTSITLNDTHLGNGDYDVRVDGTATANYQAMLGATGKAKVAVRNIEKLSAAVKTAMDAPGTSPETRERMQKALQVLTIMQVSGRKEKDAGGNNLHHFDLELGQDGKVMLNGTDLSALVIPADEKKSAP